MWQCIQCHSEYDVADIENALIEAAQRTSMDVVIAGSQTRKYAHLRFSFFFLQCYVAVHSVP